MRSPFYFIVRPLNGKRYDNIKDLDGEELIVNSSEEDHRFSNRFAEVISTPLNYNGEIVQKDILLVHHNVFKFYNDISGQKRSGKSYYKDDLFFVEHNQYFLYYHNGEWKTHDKYCFVKPIPIEEKMFASGATEEPLIGIMKYTNKELLSLGVKEGDKVSFQPDSEYEFNISGEKLYRMFTNNITMVL